MTLGLVDLIMARSVHGSIVPLYPERAKLLKPDGVFA